MSHTKHVCDIPCTLCGTFGFDDMELLDLYERTDCEIIVPMPTWQEYLDDATSDKIRHCAVPNDCNNCETCKKPGVT